MKLQKCCAHCPGKLVGPDSNQFHECCQPSYVSGELRISSLRKQPEKCSARRVEVETETESEMRTRTRMQTRTRKDQSFSTKPRGGVAGTADWQEQFALAKKLHAANLEHRPLPDKVDDSVFKVAGSLGCTCAAANCCRCCRRARNDPGSAGKRYGPVLGCKEPETKMDLAICWETPVDKSYEPPRAGHIDGSEGGLAPAIFNLVEHSAASGTTVRSGICKNREGSHRTSDASGLRGGTRAKENGKCCCDCLCKGLGGVNVSSRKSSPDHSGRESARKCRGREAERDPRLIRSAVGLALGTDRGQTDRRRNREDGATIPRPRTPFARRSFCIDTLAPPFSVVNGYRDTDYPEHWRLMSVYQQSYRNPYRRRNYRC